MEKLNNLNLDNLIDKCMSEIEKAAEEKLDPDNAEKVAALFLYVQLKLANLIEQVELKAKQAKNEVSRVESEKYFECKNSSAASDKKITEATLTNYVLKDADVTQSKKDAAELESELKKWNYIINILKDGHVFFRNLSKKAWQE